MSPKDLLDPDNLPEDLQWIAADYKLDPTDPVFVLIAWHWHSVQKAEDSLRAATLELKSAIDSRIESLNGAVEIVTAVKAQLAGVQGALEQKPLALSKRLEADLQEPVAAAVAQIKTVEKSLGGLTRTTKTLLATAQRRQALASFLIGTITGACFVLLCG